MQSCLLDKRRECLPVKRLVRVIAIHFSKQAWFVSDHAVSLLFLSSLLPPFSRFSLVLFVCW
jgi:hypothetical protein